jgi:cell division protein FtsW
MGVLFALILIAMFLFIMLRSFNRMSASGDMFSVLAVGGLLSMFGLQALIHMGSAVNILPAKGMTLPFISYGGSSLISMGITMGMVLALTRSKSRSSIARSGLQIRAKPSQQPSAESEA